MQNYLISLKLQGVTWHTEEVGGAWQSGRGLAQIGIMHSYESASLVSRCLYHIICLQRCEKRVLTWFRVRLVIHTHIAVDRISLPRSLRSLWRDYPDHSNLCVDFPVSLQNHMRTLYYQIRPQMSKENQFPFDIMYNNT